MCGERERRTHPPAGWFDTERRTPAFSRAQGTSAYAWRRVRAFAYSRFALRSSSLRRTGRGLNRPATETVVPRCDGCERRATNRRRGEPAQRACAYLACRLSSLLLQLPRSLKLQDGPYRRLRGRRGRNSDALCEGAEGRERFAAETESSDALEVGKGCKLGGVMFEGYAKVQ